MTPPDAPLDAVPAGVRSVPAVALRGGTATPTRELVAEEVPIAFEVNGINHVVMLASPLDLEDFALGFLLTEGLIDRRADLLDTEVEERAPGRVLHLRVTARCEARFKERRRNLAGRTGCGLCGTDSLDQVLRPLAAVPASAAAAIEPRALERAMEQLAAQQALQRASGAVHAAGWCAADGTLLLLREDVGRHNALDKLIGAMSRAGLDPAQGFVAVTSRASFEMVQKSAQAGIGLLAAVSAPTALAIELAASAGVTLAGFVRGDRLTVYTGAARLGAG